MNCTVQCTSVAFIFSLYSESLVVGWQLVIQCEARVVLVYYAQDHRLWGTGSVGLLYPGGIYNVEALAWVPKAM